MYYSYEEPKEEAHTISFWGKEAVAMSYSDGPVDRVLKQEVWDWLEEHKSSVIGVIGAPVEDDGPYCFTIRFRSKDAAALFKLRFQGMAVA